ncbi:MAG: exosortase/archaeosortase family protein [Isosphaeraceae bacterium]|nr:exosortase/archaeosortase family protein [Isosphaeraceae bacterium]
MLHQANAFLRSSRSRPLLVLLVLGGSLLWAYWPTLGHLAERWWHDPRYSHGFLVPVFAGVLLWNHRQQLAAGPIRPSWWGVALIAAGATLRLAGAYIYLDWLDTVSLLPSLAGLCALVGGRQALRPSWQAIGFLIFMIPLPYRVEMALGSTLQRVATRASTYTLQTLGLPAYAEGNIVTVGEESVGVAEACNGLGMLVTFFAISTAVALMIRRPLGDKIIIILSAVPIALLANVARITVTMLLRRAVGSRLAYAVYHDFAGWLMMPLALGALYLELWLLSRLFVVSEPSDPLSIARLGAVAAANQPVGSTANR